MSSFYQRPITPDELVHYGVLGMKWGVRRYQNSNGSLTATGRKRYSPADSARKTTERAKQKLKQDVTSAVDRKINSGKEHKGLSDKQKKAIKVGAAVTAAVLATAGTAYLVKSGKASTAIKVGKQVSKAVLSKGKKNVMSVLSKTAKGKIHSLTNSQLESALKRARDEKALYELQHPFRNELKRTADKTAKTAAAGAAAYLVGTAVDRRVDKNQLADYMRRGGAKKK